VLGGDEEFAAKADSAGRPSGLLRREADEIGIVVFLRNVGETR